VPQLRAGITRVCVTPPVGVDLAGYGPDRRSLTLHDHLHAEALVLDDGRARAAIVTSDLISFDAAFTDYVRRLASRQTGIPCENIMVSCVHNHTAPPVGLMPGHGHRDWEYIHIVARNLAGAIVSASRLMCPVRIGFGRGQHTGLAWNRTYEGGPVDPRVLVMRVDDEATKRPMAILINYACHPVILGPKPTISADYPGPTRRFVDSAFPGCTSMYANGPCGDIDPITNKKIWGQGTFDDVEHVARLLADDVVAVAQGIETTHEWRVGVRRTTGRLPYQSMTPDEADAEVERWSGELERGSREGMGIRSLSRARRWLEWSHGLVEGLRRGTMPSERAFELQAITLGDTAAIVALPGEIFTEIGQGIRARSVYPFTFLATCANDNVGYVATEQDFQRKGYGSSTSFISYGQLPFTTDVGQRFVEAAATLVEG